MTETHEKKDAVVLAQNESVVKSNSSITTQRYNFEFSNNAADVLKEGFEEISHSESGENFKPSSFRLIENDFFRMVVTRVGFETVKNKYKKEEGDPDFLDLLHIHFVAEMPDGIDKEGNKKFKQVKLRKGSSVFVSRVLSRIREYNEKGFWGKIEPIELKDVFAGKVSICDCIYPLTCVYLGEKESNGKRAEYYDFRLARV